MSTRSLKQSAKSSSTRRSSSTRSEKANSNGASAKTSRPLQGAGTSHVKTVKQKNTQPSRRGAPSKRFPHYRQRDGWNMVDMADGIAVHDTAFKTVHYLNHTAAVVFLLCKHPVGFDFLCAVFQEEFGLQRAPKAELQKILAEMEKIGLLLTVTPTDVRAVGSGPARKR